MSSVAPVIETWWIQIASESEALRIAAERGYGDSMKAGYSWEWRELKVPTPPLGYGWYVAGIVGAEKVKVARSTSVDAQEQVIMRIATNDFDRQPHAGLVIATRVDGCVFGFRQGSLPQTDMKFRRLSIVHPIPDAPEFMEWAGKAFGSQTTEDVYVYHVQTPQD